MESRHREEEERLQYMLEVMSEFNKKYKKKAINIEVKKKSSDDSTTVRKRPASDEKITEKKEPTILFHLDNKEYPKSECVMVGNKYYPKSHKDIALDNGTGNYNFKAQMHQIVIGYDIDALKITEGYYTSDKEDINNAVQCLSETNSSRYIYFRSVDDAIKSGFRESYKAALFFNPKLIKDSDLRESAYRAFPFVNINKKDKKEMMKYGEASQTFLVTEGKKYTFGVEIETSKGRIPQYISKDLNIECKRDGSIPSGEYATGVLVGDAGFKHLSNIVSELSKRCEVDKTCSIHVHIGNVKFDEEFVVYMYKVAIALQDDLFKLMPPSRRKSEYCKFVEDIGVLLPSEENTSIIPYDVSIKNNFDKIFRKISLGEKQSNRCNKKTNHPRGSVCGYDRKTPRYWWLNFVPALFNTRGTESYSLEFRCHSATLNFVKIKNWILLCMGIVNYVETHKEDIMSNPEKIKISNILKATFPKQSAGLISYFNDRYTLFSSTSQTAEENERKEYYKRENKSKDVFTVKEILNI